MFSAIHRVRILPWLGQATDAFVETGSPQAVFWMLGRSLHRERLSSCAAAEGIYVSSAAVPRRGCYFGDFRSCCRCLSRIETQRRPFDRR